MAECTVYHIKNSGDPVHHQELMVSTLQSVVNVLLTSIPEGGSSESHQTVFDTEPKIDR